MNKELTYLSADTLAQRYDVSKQTIWRWTRVGELPKPIKINGSTRWSEIDISTFEVGFKDE